ncbi:myelin-associated glycoprotein-like isoform X2 [Parambassis ranga]|uniref:Myelin-associated glycoprotein-like isoform X2 n=1 Tax=Parambassis ranga TaxID=210632 RepID=A0A6P7K0M0_9TELE|nr:myelin-associated glycoprotein-like isoform X2 [Parambassis ranga]
MDSLKQPWLFLCLCFTGIQTSDWTVEVPSTVKGLLGSCVVIPCSYNYPSPQKTLTKFTGIWVDESKNNIYHPDVSRMQQKYSSRTELGDVSHKNCSLKIDPLQQTDHGSFYFRIEIANFDNFSFANKKVTLQIIDQPDPVKFSMKEEIKAGETVSASCSASHSCPASPPAFNWSHPGEKRIQTKNLTNGQWEVTSTLTFRSANTDHNKLIECIVTYNGGQPLKTSKVLQIKYAPVNVMVEYKSEIKEGETVPMICSSDANPPVSSYEWHNETGAKVHEGNLYMVPNVSRHFSQGFLYCTAINKEGRNQSSLVQLNVLYAPDIKNISSCSVEGDTVKCLCIVESNPSSKANTGSFKFVHCLANNTQGKASLTLHLPADNKMQNILIAIGAAVFLVLLLITVGIVKKCRRRSETQSPPTNMSTLKSEVASTYNTTIRKEKKEDVWCPDMYANDPVYGNVQDDEDDAIYANV